MTVEEVAVAQRAERQRLGWGVLHYQIPWSPLHLQNIVCKQH